MNRNWNCDIDSSFFIWVSRRGHCGRGFYGWQKMMKRINKNYVVNVVTCSCDQRRCIKILDFITSLRCSRTSIPPNLSVSEIYVSIVGHWHSMVTGLLVLFRCCRQRMRCGDLVIGPQTSVGLGKRCMSWACMSVQLYQLKSLFNYQNIAQQKA